MTHADRSDRRGRLRGSAGLIVGLVALIGLLVPLLLDSSANAASLRTGSIRAATTCPTDPYTSSTVSECTTTTTTGTTITIILTIGYSNGTITWQACGYPLAARGSAVQLFLAGQQMTQPGGSATVQASLCAGASFALCLVPGAYPAVAVNQFGQASKTMTVTSSGCRNPITLASNSGAQTKSKSSGALAFTGSNVLILLLAALLLIALGYAIVRINRQRRHAG
jgi:hypothetical protein